MDPPIPAPFICTLDRFFVNSSVGAALLVSPVDEAPFVANSTEDLVWDAPAGYTPSGYNLYVRKNDPNFSGPGPANIIEITDKSATSPHDISGLDLNTTYYWRVDAVEPNLVSPFIGETIHESVVFSFTTEPEEPRFATQPQGQVRGPANGKLVSAITVVALNNSGFEWYKDGGDGLTDLADDTLVSGQTTDTLAITVTPGDEGRYFCVATNAAGDVASDMVYLEYARLTGQWDFENTLNDTAGTNHGTWSPPGGSANYDTGIVGSSAIDFGVDDPNGVSIPVAAVPANTKEMSISLWAKNGPMHDSGLIPFAVLDSDDDQVFLATTPWFNNAVYFNAAGLSYNQIVYWVDPGELEDVWNHWVFTFNSEDGYMAIYRNGVEVSSYSGELGNISGADAFYIGSEANSAASYYQGMIDDFRVYNYAIDEVEVAYLYTDVKTGESVCAGGAGPFDVTGAGDEPDCKIDMLDFAEFAAGWLNCNLVPDCLPRP